MGAWGQKARSLTNWYRKDSLSCTHPWSSRGKSVWERRLLYDEFHDFVHTFNANFWTFSSSLVCLNYVRVPHWYSIFQMWKYKLQRQHIEAFQGVSRAELVESSIEHSYFLICFLTVLFKLLSPAKIMITGNPHSKILVGINNLQGISINLYIQWGNRVLLSW